MGENEASKSAVVTRVAFCPHCSNTAPQRLILEHEHQERGYDSDGNMDPDGPLSVYYVAACTTCGELLLYHSLLGYQSPEEFCEAALYYPKGAELHNSVPDSVRSCYAEAARIQNTAPNAYAVMIRRALETLCDDRKVKKGSLHIRLGELAQRGEIPPVLAEMTAVLRILGNSGAHNSGQRLTVPMAWAMGDFFCALVEYVYIAPSKLKDFKEGLKNSQDAANTAPAADG